ncbi:MAG: BMP family protein [Acidimicrobiia bacterium]|nr:MAG: BMP family protein [Acidimicrobiia bacterium]
MRSRFIKILALLAVLSLVATACSSGDSTEASDTTTTTDATTTTTEATNQPTEVGIAVVFAGVKEEPWYSTMLEALDRVSAASPHGLKVNYEWFESIAYADGERVLGELAASGKYDIIIGHSIFGESIAPLQDQYPDILFAFSGSGNDPLGGNGYWIDVYTHEAAYLTGIIAGMMTKTNKISAVAAFPFPNVNLPLNAYIAGALSVNPDVEAQVTYIESWFDPTTAKESALAQIAAGADIVYAERLGPFEAAAESDGVLAFGHFSDQAALAPEVVLTSTLAIWDPAVNTLIDEWFAYVTEGKAYDAPMERILFLMSKGGTDLAALSDLVPDDVKAAVEEAKAKILSGELEVPFNDAPIE